MNGGIDRFFFFSFFLFLSPKRMNWNADILQSISIQCSAFSIEWMRTLLLFFYNCCCRRLFCWYIVYLISNKSRHVLYLVMMRSSHYPTVSNMHIRTNQLELLAISYNRGPNKSSSSSPSCHFNHSCNESINSNFDMVLFSLISVRIMQLLLRQKIVVLANTFLPLYITIQNEIGAFYYAISCINNMLIVSPLN